MRIGLVGNHPVRAAPRATTDPGCGDVDVIDQRQELWIIPSLSRGEPHRERSSAPVDTEVGLGAPSTSGATQRVVVGLRPPSPVIRPCPLWCSCVHQQHADAPAQRWSRPKPPTPSPRPRGPDPAAPRAPGPRCHPWPSGRNATRPSAKKGNPSASPATASPFGTASRSPRPLDGGHSIAHRDAARDLAAAARSWPTSHLKTASCVTWAQA